MLKSSFWMLLNKQKNTGTSDGAPEVMSTKKKQKTFKNCILVGKAKNLLKYEFLSKQYCFNTLFFSEKCVKAETLEENFGKT